uniref:Uncharacterized protein n=1 Tax=Arion vulgaris TaxID=1028688 RepID=A0A0B6Y851_9EUPU
MAVVAQAAPWCIVEKQIQDLSEWAFSVSAYCALGCDATVDDMMLNDCIIV